MQLCAALLGSALLLLALAQPSQGLSFSSSYSALPNYVGCYPNSAQYAGLSALGAPTTPKLSLGSTAYLCLNINGKVTSMYNVVVDQYSAISLVGSE